MAADRPVIHARDHGPGGADPVYHAWDSVGSDGGGVPGERVLLAVFDGAGSALVAGMQGDVSIPFASTITGWVLLADQPGSLVIDIWEGHARVLPADERGRDHRDLAADVELNRSRVEHIPHRVDNPDLGRRHAQVQHRLGRDRDPRDPRPHAGGVVTLRLVEGFDHFNTQALAAVKGWQFVSNVGGSPSFVSGRLNGRAVRLDGINSLGNVAFTKYLPAPVTTAVAGFAVNPASFPMQVIMGFVTSAGVPVVHLGFDSAGRLQILDGAATTVYATGTTVFPAGAWFYVELKAVVSGASGSVSAQVNGGAEIPATTANIGTIPIDGVQLHILANTQASYDDLYVCDTAGTKNNSVPRRPARRDPLPGRRRDAHRVDTRQRRELRPRERAQPRRRHELRQRHQPRRHRHLRVRRPRVPARHRHPWCAGERVGQEVRRDLPAGRPRREAHVDRLRRRDPDPRNVVRRRHPDLRAEPRHVR